MQWQQGAAAAIWCCCVAAISCCHLFGVPCVCVLLLLSSAADKAYVRGHAQQPAHSLPLPLHSGMMAWEHESMGKGERGRQRGVHVHSHAEMHYHECSSSSTSTVACAVAEATTVAGEAGQQPAHSLPPPRPSFLTRCCCAVPAVLGLLCCAVWRRTPCCGC